MSAPVPSLPHPVATIGKTDAVEVRVALTEFKGRRLVDVREFVPFTMAKVPMPTKKGVSLRVELLPELVRALIKAEADARALGLIGGGQ